VFKTKNVFFIPTLLLMQYFFEHVQLFFDYLAESTMKRSATAPDSQFKAAAAEESSGSLYSVAQNLFSGKLFGGYLSSDKNKEEMYKNRERRNSKSLPASPLNSPRIYRKNPYFTDPFIKPDERFDGKSFFYLSISSPRRSLETLVDPAGSSTSKPPSTESKSRPEFYPKPSELRELNCWSPISM